MSELEEIKNFNIQKRIYKLRRQGLNWVLVASKISTEFKKEISSKQVQDHYDTYIAKSQVQINSRRKGRVEAYDVNGEWQKEMKELTETIKKKALKHLEIADELLISQYKLGDTKAYFNNLPVAISLFRSLLDQANSMSSRLEKIEINQTNLVLSETQILQIVTKAYTQKAKEHGFRIHPGRDTLIPIDKKTV